MSKKHRLVIKYPVSKEYIETAYLLKETDGKEICFYERQEDYHWIKVDHKKFTVPRDWVEKIKEPVVLSAEESAKKNKIYRDEIGYDLYIDGFETGDENGQLREYYSPEQVEFREAIKEFMEHYEERHTYDGRALNIFNKLRKLKPPHERQL